MRFAYVLHGVLEKISSSPTVEWNNTTIANVQLLKPAERKALGIYDFIPASTAVNKFERAMGTSMVVDNEAGTVTEVINFVDVSLDEAKAALKQELASFRYDKEVGGIVVDGANIKTDRESQATLTGAYVKVQINPGQNIDWKTSEGWVQLTKVQIEKIAAAVGSHVQNCFSTEKSLSLAIDKLTLQGCKEFNIAERW